MRDYFYIVVPLPPYYILIFFIENRNTDQALISAPFKMGRNGAISARDITYIHKQLRIHAPSSLL